MEIKVTFRFDVSENLLACVDNFRKAAEAMAQSGILSQLPENKTAGIVKAVATENGVTMNKKEQIWPPKEEAPEPEAQEPEEPQESIPTIADMRAAVARCRERIEGADWEEKTGEGYKLYHKKVTAAVKSIVTFCEAEKIPDIAENRRQSFITQVDSLVLEGDAVISQPPF